MPRTTRNCKLLIAYDFINNISFLIDTGSSYSLISTSKRERKINPDPTVLYSATVPHPILSKRMVNKL